MQSAPQVSSTPKYFKVLAVVLILIGIGYLVSLKSSGTPDIREFSGNVESMEGDIIVLHGVFVGPAGTVPAELLAERDFSFRVDEQTQFRKTERTWPDWAELAKRGSTGTIDVQDLPTVEGPGSLADLKKVYANPTGWLHIQADFPFSIYGSQNPVALSVFYDVMVMPAPPSPPQTP